MSATSTTGRAALVAANGRARRPAEPPQRDLSHAESQRGGERRDCCQCENVANTQSQYPIGIGNNGTGNTSTMATFASLPKGWDVRYGKSIFTENKRKNKSLENSTILSLSYGKIIVKKSPDEGLVPAEYSGYQILSPGDIVIRCTDLQNDQRSQRVGIVEVEGIITSAYLGLKVNDGVSSRYIAYWLKNWDATKEIYRYGSGLRQSLSWVDLKYLPIPLPPLPEQKAIVAYLDAETGRIDKAIAAEEKMIALLQERREIVINEAVAPHDGWEVRRLGTIGEFSKGGGISRDDLQESGLPAILYGDIYTKYNHAVVEVKNHISDRTAKGAVSVEYGDILMTGSGETKEDIGKAVVFLGDSSFIGGDVICFRQKDHNSCYLSYALSSEAAKAFRYRESKGEIVVHIYASSLKQLPIPLPPLPEQEAIVERLDRETGKIDRAIEVKRRQIELLRERRQIVIDEVVTGKVKVA